MWLVCFFIVGGLAAAVDVVTFDGRTVVVAAARPAIATYEIFLYCLSYTLII